ncbi:MAG: NapC/NirT family cytochrome c [Burkholderiales bacterium]|nr:NapC/NirT family cytochrome c [Burkholderiales bacterium]
MPKILRSILALLTGPWRVLRAWGLRPGSIGVLVLGLAIGAVAFGSGASFMVYANSEQFCAQACHEMAPLHKEYTGTVHDVNRTGVRATCNDCHVPHEYVPNYLAKVGLLSDFWGHYVTKSIDTPAKLEAKRYELAKRIWIDMKDNDSRECRHCHTTAKMDPERQSPRAVARHAKGRQEGRTCIECHFGISHKEPEGPGPQELFGGGAKQH